MSDAERLEEMAERFFMTNQLAPDRIEQLIEIARRQQAEIERLREHDLRADETILRLRDRSEGWARELNIAEAEIQRLREGIERAIGLAFASHHGSPRVKVRHLETLLKQEGKP